MTQAIKYKKEEDKFHKNIERLLTSAGAEILSSDFNTRGPDIRVKFDNHKVIIKCRYSPQRKKFTNLDSLINSYSRLVQKENAKAAILMLGNYNVSDEHIKKRGKILAQDRVAIWTDKTIHSYKNLVCSIRAYAKYQIIGDLGIRTICEKIEVDAIPVHQHGFTFYTTKLSPAFLIRTGFVARRAEDPKTYQRYIVKKRVINQIPSYINHEIGIFPNSVILVSRYKLKYLENERKLVLKDLPSSLWILDGQHRVYAFTNIADRGKRENYEIICSIFDGTTRKMDHNVQANLFVKINNEAQKVSSSLITDLAESFEEIKFHHRQINLMKRLRKTSMFKGLFKPYKESSGFLNPTTFCTNQSMMRLTREHKGLIFSNIKTTSDKKEEDRAFKYLRDYFNIIASVFKKEWQDPQTYILCSDKGIRGLLNLYEKILRHVKYRNDTKRIRELIKAFRAAQLELRISELKNQYLGEGGAREMANAFAREINKTFPQFDPTLEEEKYQGRVIDQVTIYGKRDLPRAKEFIDSALQRFEGKVIGELMHIDATTFRYFETLSRKCSKIYICFQDIKGKDKKKCAAILKKLRNKGIDIILTKKKLHERWLSTDNYGADNYLIELNTDLKDGAIASKKNIKKLRTINRNTEECVKNFRVEWCTYERLEGENLVYNYDPLASPSTS